MRADWIARFWSRVSKKKAHECWPWKGGTHKTTGLGQMATEGGTRSVNQILYFIVTGAWPDHRVQRTCLTQNCGNSKHVAIPPVAQRRSA